MAAHNLPTFPTPFIGRTDEIADLSQLLDDPNCRLLTLVGPGGIGKTRLAVEVARCKLEAFPDGVYFVPLQPVAAVENIVPTITRAVGFNFSSGSDLESQLCQYLCEKQMLLILDNFEHLLAASDLIVTLTTSASCLKLLVTSREALSLRDEWLIHVEGLSFPQSEHISGSDRYDAINLFVAHAHRARHDFSLADESAHVARICQLVQGMPLALELAATWLRRLPCVEILSELQGSLDILKTDLRDMPARHRSMRVVFDNSWQLLDEDECEALVGLSVFRGGFRRKAAEAVAGASLEVLMSLVDKSLLTVSDSGRYEIHELIRQYAQERLDETPERKQIARDGHCAYFMTFMDRPVSDFLGKGNREKLKAIDAEIDNVRSAWYWAVDQQRVSDLYRATGGLYWYSWMRQWHVEGEAAFRDAETALRAARPTRANQIALAVVLKYQAAMDMWLGSESSALARERAQESVTILRRLDARHELGSALGVLGWTAIGQGDQEAAKPLLEKAVTLLDETGPYELQSFYMSLLSAIARQEGDYEAFEYWHQQALALSRRIGDQRTIAAELAELGNLARLRGQYHQAHQWLQESLAVAQAAETSQFVTISHHKLGELAQTTGQLDTARAHFEASLRLARDNNTLMQISWSLTHIADVLALQGDQVAARERYHEVLKIIPDRGSRWGYARALTGLGDLAWHEGDYEAAWQYHHESLKLQRQHNVPFDIIRNLIALGRIALVRGDSGQARDYFREALQEAIPPGFTPTVLDILTGVAEMFLAQGNRVDAWQLAALVSHHPASPTEAKIRAEAMLAGPEAKVYIAAQSQEPLPDVMQLATGLMNEFAAAADPIARVNQSLPDPLTPRELEVLNLLAEGLTNAQVAERLFVTTGAIKRYASDIYGKLGVHSRVQAVSRAREIGLL